MNEPILTQTADPTGPFPPPPAVAAAPPGQGITDKAFLAGYKSPNNTGPAYWTVTTK